MNPEPALFAIDAGTKLGRKAHQVLIDETYDRPMVLPLCDLFGSIADVEALEFFARPGKKGGKEIQRDPGSKLEL